MVGKAGGVAAGDAVALLRDERDRAIEMLRRIEEDGWTFHAAESADAASRDITDKSANRQRQIIERMDRLIEFFENVEV